MAVETFSPAVSLTEAAIQHFRAALADKPGQVIRLSTKSSGCSGYSYVLNVAPSAEPEDEIVEPDGNIRLAIAADAVPLLRGTRIDIVKEGINHVVRFVNPNVVGECGCGESFSVK
ncbi:MAG TPA: iron-sulfur cluster assembly accessory protein [Spongiibacteraceae bacterium]|jgi:iron-sulfur cluster assembly accessory protein|nr:iron-sulfur cluster assembly accessory protein [Spongiibacteraceae bacterium]HUH39114.1 iron-sulfur cluster assembly accessory protein [Spongiibacteraceae bacterium]